MTRRKVGAQGGSRESIEPASHPALKANLLIAGVVLVLFLLAIISTVS